MGLVDYSSSEGEGEPAAKKPKIEGSVLPPLPSNFRDLYSSTVRTSTQDDPELHRGRKRVTPHVAGNWPAHVFLESGGTPERSQSSLLAAILDDIETSQDSRQNEDPTEKVARETKETHSLLENDLGVPLPLHISLSRPLSLKTAQKDTFLPTLTTSITSLNVRAFTVSPNILTWHPNEDRTRWFLVLSLQRPEHDELNVLLGACNRIARDYGQPLLYSGQQGKGKGRGVYDGKFHVSIAWSLVEHSGEVDLPEALSQRLDDLTLEFREVKVRIGQDVTALPLRKRRGALLADEGSGLPKC